MMHISNICIFIAFKYLYKFSGGDALLTSAINMNHGLKDASTNKMVHRTLSR